MSIISSPSRAGSALVISSIVIITIASMAILLTDLTISRYTEQKYRQAQVDLLAATESAANETIHWMKNSPEVQYAMQHMAISSRPGFPETKRSTSAVLVSTSLPSGLPPVFPALTVRTASMSYAPAGATQGGTTPMIETNAVGANEANRRNACTVETKVIKVASSVTPSRWDDSEKFIIYTTAETGDRARPESVRRQRVETVILAKSKNDTVITPQIVPTPAFPFTRGLFSINGYDFKGTATTDSWMSDSNGDGIADTPYIAPATYTVGGANSHGDLGSNGPLGLGAYDTSKVHGQATPYADAALPTVTYAPPTTGVTALPIISANKTLTGSGTGTTVFRTPSVDHNNRNTLTIAGSGTVVLYVDGAFNVGNVVFAAESTAKVIIYQNDVAGRGCSFNSQSDIGDARDPKRLMLVTAFSGTFQNEMSLNGGANFSAVVLAPNAGIKFNGNSNFYGAFVAKDFSGAVNGTFKFHYDESLRGLSMGMIDRTVNVETTVSRLDTLRPIVWNIRSVGYNAP